MIPWSSKFRVFPLLYRFNTAELCDRLERPIHCFIKGALYIIWCGVNTLDDSGVNVV